MMKRIAVLSFLLAFAVPSFTFAQVTSLSSSSNSACTDFKTNLRLGSDAGDTNTKLAVLNLQLALKQEGFDVPNSELGVFGNGTLQAVKSFQEKYQSEILAPFNLSSGSGYVGAITRLKLQALYGCRAGTSSSSNVSINLSVPTLSLDSNGVTFTTCNNGKNDLTTAPIRIRLNGINRDFEIIGAQKAGTCDTESISYATWGLSYNQGNTYTAISLIDPNGYYKTGNNVVPLTQTTTLNVQALAGAHLSVRSVIPKTNGIQATLCNLGTVDLQSFPVKVTVNGSTQNLDVLDAYKANKCSTVTWPYSTFSLSYAPNTSYAITVTTDPNNIYNEVNELDNTASTVGTP